jgi:hypothetical protein
MRGGIVLALTILAAPIAVQGGVITDSDIIPASASEIQPSKGLLDFDLLDGGTCLEGNQYGTFHADDASDGAARLTRTGEER